MISRSIISRRTRRTERRVASSGSAGSSSDSAAPTAWPSGAAAIAAIYPDARNPFAHPELLRDEGLEEWAVTETWLMAHAENDHFVDITDVFLTLENEGVERVLRPSGTTSPLTTAHVAIAAA